MSNDFPELRGDPTGPDPILAAIIAITLATLIWITV